MDLRRLARSLAAALAALTVFAGPVAATEEQPTGTTEEAPAEEAPAEEEHGERTKRQLPLDLTDPQHLFGAILLGLGGLGAVLAGANLLKQLRGERPTASGEWRPR